jgi:hypothetical protein
MIIVIENKKYKVDIKSKPEIGDFGIIFAEGFNGIGGGYSIFYHDNSKIAKINCLTTKCWKVILDIEEQTLPKIDECLNGIKQICENDNDSDELLKHKANWIYILNKLNFWDDVPILLEILKYEIKNKK